jgi:prepilin-type N-terminal cleavage/methylation domain-containing protein
MKINRLRGICRGQKGFTLLELLLAMFITVILGGVVTMSIFQVIDINARNTTHMIEIKEVENAFYWITVDAQMAQMAPDAQVAVRAFPMTLSWANKYDNYPTTTTGSVTYSIVEDHKLQREYFLNNVLNMTTIVAENIESALADSYWSYTGNYDDGWAFTFKITSRVPGSRPYSETRLLEILPRSSPE